MNAYTSPWTDETLDLLKGMVKDRLSSGQIVKAFHARGHTRVTRNAIVGKVHRLGLQLNGNSQSGRKRKLDPNKKLLAVNGRRAPRSHNTTKGRLLNARAKANAAPATVNGHGVHLMRLTSRHCHFPLWDDNARTNLIYCGHEVERGGSYCKHHRERMKP